jgi:hypothetical protein
MLVNTVKLIREDMKLINRCSTAPSLSEREKEGEAVIKIMVPAFVFHRIMVASQSFHRHTNVEQRKTMTYFKHQTLK